MKSTIGIFVVLLATTILQGCKKDNSEPKQRDGLYYHLRYCEVLMGSLSGSSVQADVYNTLFCNSCPQEAWDTIDYASIAAEYNVLMALENGPRYWVLDSIDGSQNPSGEHCGDTVGGLPMTLVASVTVDPGNVGNPYYIPTTVARTTVYHFNKGREVYQLRSATDSCYIMQSYSLQNDSTLELSVLPGLSQRLTLPVGWSFNTHILNSKFELSSENGEATIVSDDLRNTYQYLHTGCLD